jgi:hypothetical protein
MLANEMKAFKWRFQLALWLRILLDKDILSASGLSIILPSALVLK